MTVTADQFLDELKRRITVPANQVLLTNTNLLNMTHEVMQEKLTPLILSTNQNYYVTETAIELVAEKKLYDIPYRAIARSLRDVKLRIGTDDNTTSSLPLIALEDLQFYPAIGTPSGICFIGDKLRIVPTPVDASRQVVVYYDRQPSRPVQANQACKVVAISGDTVTCDSVPSDYVAGSVIDFIDGKAACSLKGMDVEVTNVAGTQISFGVDAVPEELAIGDYISFAQTSPVMQMPDECSPLLQLWTAERVLYAIGDFEGANLLVSRAKEVRDEILKMLAPRIEGSQTKIINRNGLLRRNLGVWRLRGGFYG
jgi:hypothetical protein